MTLIQRGEDLPKTPDLEIGPSAPSTSDLTDNGAEKSSSNLTATPRASIDAKIRANLQLLILAQRRGRCVRSGIDCLPGSVL